MCVFQATGVIEHLADGDFLTITDTVQYMELTDGFCRQNTEFGQWYIESFITQQTLLPQLQDDCRGHGLADTGDMELVFRRHQRITVSTCLTQCNLMAEILAW